MSNNILIPHDQSPTINDITPRFNPASTHFTGKITAFLATTYLGVVAAYSHAVAAPQGGAVVGGQADITVTGHRTEITQSSQRAAIDWQSFSVNRDETVNFNVPDGGATLNRVVGLDPSQISGHITSNGSVFLVNPNGLVFETGSAVFAQNFVASTANITTDNFMAGQYKFAEISPHFAAKITLKGEITAADRGFIGIFAPEIDQQGIVTANLGQVVLGGASRYVLDFAGNGLFNFELGAGDDTTATLHKVSHSGTIQASGGKITLTARAARQLVAATVESSGTLNATSLTEKGGVIELRAEQGDVTISGTIDASGANGGGDIIIGGNFHGRQQAGPAAISNRLLLNSENVYITKNATIRADSLGTGNGGNIAIWSDYHTQFLGTVTAEGAPAPVAVAGTAEQSARNIQSDGGFIETSGKQTLDFQGKVSTLAPQGKNGTLLLDPADILIGATSDASVATYNSANGTTNATWSVISASAVQTLLATTSVAIDAFNINFGGLAATSGTGSAGRILVSGAINSTSGNSLSLNGNFVTISTSVTVKGDINLTGNSQVAVLAGGALSANGNITVTSLYNSGSTNGFTAIDLQSSSLEAGGNITLKSSNQGNINLQNLTKLKAGGDITVQSGESTLNNNGISIAGNSFNPLTIEAGGRVSLATNGGRLNHTLAASLTVKTRHLRIDLAGGNYVSANARTMNATGIDVYYTSATSGNSGTIAVGNGSFTYVNDKRNIISAVNLTNSTMASDALHGWGAAPGLGGTNGNRTLGGLSITGSNDAALQNIGVVYGGVVTLQAVTSTSNVGRLNYIQGASINLLNNNEFAGNIGLYASTGDIGIGGGTLNMASGAVLKLMSNGGNITLAGNVTLAHMISASPGTINIDLGAGSLAAGAHSLTANGYSVNWQSGAGISGAGISGAVLSDGGAGIALDLGGGVFNALMTTSGNVTLDNGAIGGGIHDSQVNGAALTLPLTDTRRVRASGGIFVGIMTDGDVTMDGVVMNGSNKASLINYIKAANITIQNSNEFSGGINLVAGINNNITLNGNLSSHGATSLMTSGGSIIVTGTVQMDAAGSAISLVTGGGTITVTGQVQPVQLSTGTLALTSSGILSIAAEINLGNDGMISLESSNSGISITKDITAGDVRLNAAGSITGGAGLGNGLISARNLLIESAGDVSLSTHVNSIASVTLGQNSRLSLTNDQALSMGGDYVFGAETTITATVIDLTDNTIISSDHAASVLTLLAAVQGNNHDLALGKNDSKFHAINLAGSMTDLASVKIYAENAINWQNSQSRIAAGSDNLVAPRYDTRSASGTIQIFTIEQPASPPATEPATLEPPPQPTSKPTVSTLGDVSKVSKASNVSKVSNVSNVGKLSDGATTTLAAIPLQETPPESLSPSAQTSESSALAVRNIAAALTSFGTMPKSTTARADQAQPIAEGSLDQDNDDVASNATSSSESSESRQSNRSLQLLYQIYAPLVKLSDDLSANYLYPMAANPDNWDTVRGD